MQPTSPLRTTEDIIEAYNIFHNNNFNFLVSVTPIDPHYFHWAMTEDEGYRMFFRDEFMKERELLPPVFRPNGAKKIAKIEELEKVQHFFGKNLGVIEMPEERSIHVGNKLEFDFCEFLLEKKHERA